MNSHQIRCSNSFKQLLAEIKLEYIKNNKKPPSEKKITEMIARRLNKEKKVLCNDEFIKI